MESELLIPDSKLTPEQINNWRTTLLTIIGPVALILPDEDIQRYRDRMQEILDREEETR